ncbi:MAG: glucosamine inositolphosphorylceramide transferase family protein [Terriglobia bacterium]
MTGAPRPECLQFAVVVDPSGASLWQAASVRHLVESEIAQLALVITASADRFSSLQSRRKAACIPWRAFRATLGRLRSDTRVSPARLGAADEVREELFSQNLASAKAAAVGNVPGRAPFDFLLDLSTAGADLALAEAGRLGIWRFSWGASGYDREFAGFWELLGTMGGVDVALRRIATDALLQGTILRQGVFPVTGHTYRDTVERAFAGSLDFPLLACRQALDDCVSPTQADVTGVQGAKRSADSRTPNAPKVLLFFARLLLRKLFWVVRCAFHRVEWDSGIIRRDDINPTACSTIRKVEWLRKSDKSHWYEADPFIRRWNQGYALLTETMLRKEQRGVITAWRILEGRAARLGIVLDEKDRHLSYPYLFDVDGTVYCVPEQNETGAIVIYRATEFPTQWIRVGELISGIKAVDPTLFRYKDYWWLVCTEVWPYDPRHTRYLRARPDSVSRLQLWYASDLAGPWRPHARNPVKIDARCSRSAGTPFYYDGCLVRPSQDCSRTYGVKVAFNHIIKLTPTEFEERNIGELLPDPAGPYPEGLHHVSLSEDVAAIDGCRLVFDPLAWLGRMRGMRRNRRVSDYTRTSGLSAIPAES